MNRKILFAVFILFFAPFCLKCQTWIKIFNGSQYIHAHNVLEYYDKGYLIIGKQWSSNNQYGWIVKTTVNGDEIWSKYYGRIGKYISFEAATLTNNEGIAFIGGSNELNQNCTDPIIVKINTCGEKEWCKIYKTNSCDSYGIDIVKDFSDGYTVLIQDWIIGPDVWLFRLDSFGDIIWTQNYVNDPNIFWSPVGKRLLCTSDTCVLLTGRAYTPDSLTPSTLLVKMFHVKVDMTGAAIFELPWGMNNGMISEGHQTIEDTKHKYYSAGRRVGTAPPTLDMPSLFITSATGNPIDFSDLRSTGLATTINWLEDSTLVIGVDFQDYNGGDTVAVAKLDTIGNILKTKTLIPNENIVFEGSDGTFDNKIVLVGNTILNWQYSYLFKLNSTLEYDSIYNTPFTYDSLCPYPIVSDTIPLDDCQVVVVGIDEAKQNPATTKLKVYPNPGDEQITIMMPKFLLRKSSGKGITATTIYHQWKEVRLEVFDLFGRLIYCEMIPQPEKTVEIDVSDWKAGMYLARIVFMNEVAAREKFVVE